MSNLPRHNHRGNYEILTMGHAHPGKNQRHLPAVAHYPELLAFCSGFSTWILTGPNRSKFRLQEPLFFTI
jgi:hypothetical protein